MLEYYTDYHSSEFERLIVTLSEDLFGMGVQGFSDGPDGGRDALFIGTAEVFPSSREPWEGTTVIQAKHTNGYNKYFKQSDFYSPKSQSAILNKEIPRIKKLLANGKLDNYALFANRNLPGEANDEIVSFIERETGLAVNHIRLIGIEEIQRYVRSFKRVEKRAGIYCFDKSLTIYTQDLATVISALAKGVADFGSIKSPTPRTTFRRKNQINKMSSTFAELIRKNNLHYTGDIDKFLNHPDNEELRDLYFETVEDYERKVLANHDPSKPFDAVYNQLIDLIIQRDDYLKSRNIIKLTKAMIFYMYWSCDLGKSESDVTTNETHTS